MVKNDEMLVHTGPRTVAKRQNPAVQVVTCGTAFPISTKPARPARPAYEAKISKEKFLDWHDTVKEVRSLGSTGFTGKQKRKHDDEQYKLLTGRDKKKQQIPLPIVRGLKKKAVQREARQLQEAKDAGIVLPTATAISKEKTKTKPDSTNRVHGPAPSIGFMKKGVYRVNQTKK
jgi:Domain of unknown function (DUF4602)